VTLAARGRDSPGRHRRTHKKRSSRPLTRRLARGAGRIFLDAASARYGTLVIGLVLARMMSPPEFGAFGVIVVALLGAQSVSDLGSGHALALWRTAPDDVTPTVTTVSLAASAVACAAVYAVAPALAAGLGSPAAARAIQIALLSVLVSGLVAAPRAVLQRRAPWLRVMIEQVDNWIGVAVTIGLVARGHGLMAFAVGRIAGSLASAVLFIAFSPRAMRIGLHRDSARVLLPLALPFAASGLLAFAITNADQIIIGRILHAADLGYYVLALCIASWPVTVLSQPVRDAAPVAFARFRRGPQIAGSAFTSSANLLAALVLPVCVLISSLAAPLVAMIYGPAWAPAAPVLAWLAPLAALRVFYALANDYFAALASSRRGLVFQLTWLAALVPAMAAGAFKRGILAVAVIEVLVAALFLVPWYLAKLRTLASRPSMSRSGLVLPVMASACVGLMVLGARRLAPRDDVTIVIGASAVLGAMGLLIFRLRTLYVAVRRASTRAARRPARVPDVMAPAIAEVFEPALYPRAAPLHPRVTPLVREPAEADLESKVRKGTRWSALNSLVIRIIGFLVGVALARTVFGPTVYGLYAVSQIVLAFLLSANELGVSAAIVRWEGDIRSFARTVFTLSLTTSTALYAALYVAAPSVARLLGSPDATRMLRVLCICVIIDGACAVPLALLTREFAQGRRMVVDLLNFGVDTAVTLWLAFSGQGAMSFAWGGLAGCVVAMIAAMVAAPHFIVPGWNGAHARQLLRYGLPLAAASLFTLGAFNVDSAIVGATLGPAMLGLYQLAFNISSWPVTTISQAVQRVAFAGFSRVAGSGQGIANAFTSSLGLLMTLSVPPCVLLVTLAGPLIHAIYGERWLSAAPALSLLAVLGLMRVAYGMFGNAIAAADRRSRLMVIQALWLAVLIPVLLAGARLRGITGVSAGHDIVAAVIIGPAFLWVMSREGISLRAMAMACLRPLAGGALMAGVSLLVIHVAGNGLLGLAAAVIAAGAVYLPIVYPTLAGLRRSPSPQPAMSPQAASTESQLAGLKVLADLAMLQAARPRYQVGQVLPGPGPARPGPRTGTAREARPRHRDAQPARSLGTG
jgi:O-antigen/teichoic acid export membrane protein